MKIARANQAGAGGSPEYKQFRKEAIKAAQMRLMPRIKNPRIASNGLDPRLLDVIPASWVSLYPTTVHSRSIQQLEYLSPAVKSPGLPDNAAGTSALVVRSDPEQFASGSDVFDFSHLNPGWVVESVQLQTYSIACGSSFSHAQSPGEWNITWNQRGFRINWQAEACNKATSPVLSFSEYAAKVWVIGPAGTKPIAGEVHQ